MGVFALVFILSAFDLLTGGLFYLFGSQVDSKYAEEVKKYEAGEIWWWEVRNNEQVFQSKIQHCKDMAHKGSSVFSSNLCKFEALKSIINYYALSGLKSTLIFMQRNVEFIVSSLIICLFALSLAYVIDRRIYYLGIMKKEETRVAVSAEVVAPPCIQREDADNSEKSLDKDEISMIATVEEPVLPPQVAKAEDSSTQFKVKLMRKSASSGPKADLGKSRDHYLPKKTVNTAHL